MTFDNVCRVEAMIHENRAYRRAQDPKSGPKGKDDHGSSAYWFDRLKAGENHADTGFCENLVFSLDSENSTHLSSRNGDGGTNGRGIMTGRVLMLLQNMEGFCENLQRGDCSLIQQLACPDDNYNGRELAFASKFCHYAAFWLFKGKKEADNYSIYDSIVSNALVDYARKYGVDGKEIERFEKQLRFYNSKSKKEDWGKFRYDEFYAAYRSLIDATRKKASKRNGGDEISRNGFDHLLWYASWNPQ